MLYESFENTAEIKSMLGLNGSVPPVFQAETIVQRTAAFSWH